MLRETLFWEVEVVRVEEGVPTGRPWRLDFSLRPLAYALGVVLAAETVLVAYLFLPPAEDESWRLTRSLCSCGVVDLEDEGLAAPPAIPDSTLLVRRLP